ncbi:MAG: aspartate-semialdehyde dehydrogenase [Chlamydiae bacterium]|nr:aspartate-semialdehyde dehydrogenase [Chlamydiota bacterium]
MKVAIVGATGAVGRDLISLIENRNFPVSELVLFASERSLGSSISFKEKSLPIQILKKNSLEGFDIAFFSAGSKVAKHYAPLAVASGAVVIDNSSAFRLDPVVPLIIPEVNPEALWNHKGIIANPNCATIILLMALAPLHKRKKIKRMVVSTYQAASGAGAKGVEDLLQETHSFFTKETYHRQVVPFPYAFNLFLHNSALKDNTYNEEEWKIICESKKILKDDQIGITATCVRVPVIRAHCESVNVQFHEYFSAKEAYEILSSSPGIKILEDKLENRFPMPIDAIGQSDIFCGRIREDISQPFTLDLWIVGDQILKGASLNAIQIAETMLKIKHPNQPKR